MIPIVFKDDPIARIRDTFMHSDDIGRYWDAHTLLIYLSDPHSPLTREIIKGLVESYNQNLYCGDYPFRLRYFH